MKESDNVVKDTNGYRIKCPSCGAFNPIYTNPTWPAGAIQFHLFCGKCGTGIIGGISQNT